MNKFAALSPAIQALEQVPVGESQRQIFERHIGDVAYQVFATKYPDLVESIVTYKLLDTNPDAGTGFGAFILDLDGEILYVPTVFADSELNPIEIMYIKSKGIFAPLTPEWVAATRRGADQALGEAKKPPDTVATDVDIRNLMVPPMTGRYSYASDASVTEEVKLAAASSEPLGRRLMKLAEQIFDPQMWESFVSQYGQMYGVSPGAALDAGQTSLDELSKLYKKHTKTWGAPQPQQQQPQMAPQQQMPMDPMKMGSVGSKIDQLLGSAGYGAAVGGATGGLTAVYDGQPRDAGNRILQGALGGALGGTIGGTVGHSLNAKHPKATQGMADEIGHIAGGILGGLSASDPERIGLAPNAGYVDPTMYRYASHNEGLLEMAKHAAAPSPEYKPRLLDYLHQAPNAVKTAFAAVLKKRKHLLKFAAEAYGPAALLESLKAAPEQPKVAAHMEKAVKVTTKGDKPASFRGTLLRGYYYEDTKPAKNIAVLKQEYRDATDIRESGVYNLFKADGTKVRATVLADAVDLLGEYQHRTPDAQGLARTEKRVAILDGGMYLCVDSLFGEKIVDDSGEVEGLETPKQGLGLFICKGADGVVRGSCPLRLTRVRVLDGGVVEARATSPNGDREKRLRLEGGRLIRPAGGDFVVVPASWRWVPLNNERMKNDILLSSQEIVESVLSGLGKTLRVTPVESSKQAEALAYLANTYEISGADAEAILKIAELNGRCTPLILPKSDFLARVKTASPIEQAFGEILQELGFQMENIQGQMQVLQSVQQRAQELAQGAGQPPTAMQQTDPAMQTPAAPVDPAAQDMDPAMQPPADPAMQAPPEPPPLPLMTTEGPSSMEIEQQINPVFLEQAAAMQHQGVFDTGVLAELERASRRAGVPTPAPVSEHTQGLEATVDDLGRTLLSLQLKSIDLQKQLSGDAYRELEEQVRNTFQGLGKLLLELNQHSAALTHAQDTQTA